MEELIFLVLIPLFLIVNIKPFVTNIRKLYLSYRKNRKDEILKYESESGRYAFIEMYQRLSRRRTGLILLLPLLYISILVVFIPIASKGVLSWKSVLMLFDKRSIQLVFLPLVLIPAFISLRIYVLSRNNTDMLKQIYDRLSIQEVENIDRIKEKQMAYVFTGEFLINLDGCLNIVPLKEIQKIEYKRYFYFLMYVTRLRISCNKKYVIWNYAPSEAEWIERGFPVSGKNSGKSVSCNIQLPH